MILLCADPAKVTGLAALVVGFNGARVYPPLTMQVKFAALPAPATQVHEAAVKLVAKVFDFCGQDALEREWHWVAEQMFVGANSGSAFVDARLTGQLYQALEMGVPGATFVSAAHYQATQWRTVLGKGVGQMKGQTAKPVAVSYVRSRFGLEVSDHEAEAVCLGLYRLQQLEKEDVDKRLGIVERTVAKRRTTKREA